MTVSRYKQDFSIRKFASTAAVNLLLWIFSLSCVAPIIWMFYSSFKTRLEFDKNVIALPGALDFTNYSDVIRLSPLPLYMFNTLRNTVISLFFILLFAFINGFFISRYRFKGRTLLYAFYLIGMLIPIHVLLIPICILFNLTNLINAWYTVPLAGISFGIPTTLFLVESYITTIPKEIDEAAAIDGSSFSRTLFTIILPITTPILVTSGIITFFGCWNEFGFSLVLLENPALRTITLGLTLLKSQYNTNYPRMITCMFIAILPAIVIYFLFAKQIIRGMMSGAIKG